MGAEQSGPASPVANARALQQQAEDLHSQAGGDSVTQQSMMAYMQQAEVQQRVLQQLGFEKWEWSGLWRRLGADEAPLSRDEWGAIWADVIGPLGPDRVVSEKLFTLMDANGDGSLTRDEIKAYLVSNPEKLVQLEEELGTRDWDSLFRRLDAAGAGALDRAAFARLWTSARTNRVKPAVKPASRRVSVSTPVHKPAPKLASAARAVMAGGLLAASAVRRDSDTDSATPLSDAHPAFLRGELCVAGSSLDSLGIDQRRRTRSALRRDIAELLGVGVERVAVDTVRLADGDMLAAYRVFGSDEEVAAAHAKAAAALAAADCGFPGTAAALAEPRVSVAHDGDPQGAGVAATAAPQLRLHRERSSLHTPETQQPVLTSPPPPRRASAPGDATIAELQAEFEQLEARRRHLNVPALKLGKVKPTGRGSPGPSSARNLSPRSVRSPPPTARSAGTGGVFTPRCMETSPRVGELGIHIGNMVEHTLDVERNRMLSEVMQERDQLQGALDKCEQRAAAAQGELRQLRETHAVEIAGRARELDAAREAVEVERAARSAVQQQVRELQERVESMRGQHAEELRSARAEVERRGAEEAAARARAEGEARLQRERADALRAANQAKAGELVAAVQRGEAVELQLGKERERAAALAGELRQLRERLKELEGLLAAERAQDKTEALREELAAALQRGEQHGARSAELERSGQHVAQERDEARRRAADAEAAAAELRNDAERRAAAHAERLCEVQRESDNMREQLTAAAVERGRLEGRLQAAEAAAEAEQRCREADVAEAQTLAAAAAAEAAAQRARAAAAEQELQAGAAARGKLEGLLQEMESRAEAAEREADTLRAAATEAQQAASAAIAAAEERAEEAERCAAGAGTLEAPRALQVRQPEAVGASEDCKLVQQALALDIECALAELFSLQFGGRRREAAPSPRGARGQVAESPRRARCRAMFRKLDANGNGALTRAEVLRGIREDSEVRGLLGLGNFRQSDAEGHRRFEELFQSMDADDSREIDLDEFLSVLAPHMDTAAGAERQDL